MSPAMFRRAAAVATLFAAAASLAEDPVAEPAARPSLSCPAGKEPDAVTGSHCCWAGQGWLASWGACMGRPKRCPAFFSLNETRDGCEPNECEVGRVRMGDGVHCCLPGQTWDRAAARCKGARSDCGPMEFPGPDGESCRVERGLLTVQVGIDPRPPIRLGKALFVDRDTWVLPAGPVAVSLEEDCLDPTPTTAVAAVGEKRTIYLVPKPKLVKVRVEISEESGDRTHGIVAVGGHKNWWELGNVELGEVDGAGELMAPVCSESIRVRSDDGRVVEVPVDFAKEETRNVAVKLPHRASAAWRALRWGGFGRRESMAVELNVTRAVRLGGGEYPRAPTGLKSPYAPLSSEWDWATLQMAVITPGGFVLSSRFGQVPSAMSMAFGLGYDAPGFPIRLEVEWFTTSGWVIAGPYGVSVDREVSGPRVGIGRWIYSHPQGGIGIGVEYWWNMYSGMKPFGQLTFGVSLGAISG